MREIKFRGRHVEYHDEIYYGFYVMDARGNHFIIDSNNIMHIVDPESVAQFVGHDKNGNEVYEGDVLVDSNGVEYTARLESIHQDELGRFSFWEYPSQLTLKEAQAC